MLAVFILLLYLMYYVFIYLMYLMAVCIIITNPNPSSPTRYIQVCLLVFILQYAMLNLRDVSTGNT